MPRCLHINESGIQCVSASLEPTDFCDAHQTVVPFERSEENGWRKLFLRLVALILLIMFLIPLIYSIRGLYVGPPAKAQEVW